MKTEITKKQKDYELIDSGEGEKLERFGQYVLRRPDPQALWQKKGSELWEEADAFFSRDEKKGVWKYKKDVPHFWNIEFGGLTLKISPTAFKHTGLFPEQLSNWEWMEKLVKGQSSNVNGEKIKILNLFGYTGGASVALAKAGASVCHVDASKTSLDWARENALLSGLDKEAVRWILDDAHEFVKREIRRGNKYDGILLDPPAYGHGPKGETWKIEEGLLELVSDTKKLLSDNPVFYLLNGYSAGYSAIAYENNISDLKEKFGGELEKGELAIEENSGRLLPSGIFARWGNKK